MVRFEPDARLAPWDDDAWTLRRSGRFSAPWRPASGTSAPEQSCLVNIGPAWAAAAWRSMPTGSTRRARRMAEKNSGP